MPENLSSHLNAEGELWRPRPSEGMYVQACRVLGRDCYAAAQLHYALFSVQVVEGVGAEDRWQILRKFPVPLCSTVVATAKIPALGGIGR